MKSKEEFKIFVGKYPSFASHVLKGKTSWQKLFELYNLYDEDASVWDEYKSEVAERTAEKVASSVSFASIVNSLKGINLDSFQSNLSNIQKAVSFLEEFTRKDPKKEESKKSSVKEPGNIDRFYTD